MKSNHRTRFSSGATLLVATLLGIGLLGLLAACGGSEPEESDAQTQQEAATPTAQAVQPTVAPSASDIAPSGTAETLTPVGERPEYGGTLRFARRTLPASNDPYAVGFSQYFQHWNSLNEQKFPYDRTKGIKYEPGLATEYSQSQDGSKWLFKLRQGVTWHDGEAFTADDVVTTVQRLLDPELIISTRAVHMRKVWTGVRKIDDYTVELDTGVANASAFAYISSYHFLMMPDHVITGVDPTSTNVSKRWNFMHPAKAEGNSGSLAIGTGPFKLTKYDADSEWVAEKYPNYWKFDDAGNRLPYLDKIVWEAVPDGTRRLARFVAGDVGYSVGTGAGLHPTKAKALCSSTRDKGCYVLEFPHGYFAWFTNFESTPAFTDGRMNAAARYSQDMDEILRLSYGGRQGFMAMDRGRFPDTALTLKEQYEVLPWSKPDRREEFKQKAKDLVVEAGFPNGLDLPLPIFSGNLCSGSFLDEYSRHVDLFYRVGIRGFLECRQGVVVNDELRAGKWSLNGPGTSITTIDPGYGLEAWHLLNSPPIGQAPWFHPGMDEIDALFRKAQKTPDEALRNEVYKSIERFIANPELNTFPTGYTVVHLAAHGCVRNFRPGGTWGSHIGAHENTWLAKECR